jgi:hypothetical protein
VVRYQAGSSGPRLSSLPPDFDELTSGIFEAVKNYTATSPERVQALVEAVKYIVQKNIAGALAECGVWRGGSAMAMALTLKHLGATEREIYLYDTFSGMTPPSQLDISFNGMLAQHTFSATQTSPDASNWYFAPLEEVRNNVLGTGYPKEKVRFITGKVEDTIPGTIPTRLALLRLDTDWYESTKHELTHLFPRLSPYGVLIIDDYGHWQGARRAVDEYLEENHLSLLLHRIDYTGRLTLKTP